jgi:hypothetical protein
MYVNAEITKCVLRYILKHYHLIHLCGMGLITYVSHNSLHMYTLN